MRSRLRRLLWLVPLGLLLSAVAGYVGAIVLPKAIAVWVALLFLKLITLQIGDFFLVLAGPALYGLLFTWPVNCVLLPLASVLTQRTSASTPFVFLALGAASGGALGYLGVATGLYGFNPDDALWFALAGAVAGAMTGIIFGLLRRRPDRDS